jgi:hypothetical protein
MSNYYQEKNDIILKQNLSNLNLIDKNIIYSSQHISNDDTQIDSDGPQSSWNITIVCIEKIEGDYIFHINYSGYIHDYSYPYLKVVNNFTTFSRKLSELKNDFNTILEKPTYKIADFLKLWEDEYCCAFHSNDTDLINEMKILASKIESINEIYEQRSAIENEERDKKYQEYKQNPKNEEELKREKIEEDILKRCIDMYGEEEGYQFYKKL